MSRIDEIKVDIKKLENELKEIQNACPHPPLVLRYLYESNTGNFDRHDDSYWTELHCTLCTKRWREEGSPTQGKFATRVTDRKDL